MRILHLFFCALLSLSGIAIAAQPARTGPPVGVAESRAAEVPSVTVVLPKLGTRELRIPWQLGMTVETAIARAAGSKSLEWDEAWRWRANFWTRNFRDPQSFWARLLAGERATGFEHFLQAQGSSRKAQLRPGDRIFVDLEPIG